MLKEVFDEWLVQLFSYEYLTECIPNGEMHQFLLDNIDEYTEETVLNILRCLLHSYNRPADNMYAVSCKDSEYVEFCEKMGVQIKKTEYFHRLVNEYEAWEGLTWIVQLVRYSPMESIKALGLYMNAECGVMPDFRIMGIGQCIDIIEKKFINNFSNKEATLLNLGSREFEILIFHLYKDMKYDAILTPATRDGGKDVVATRNIGDGIEKLYIECKRYKTTELNTNNVNAFLGVIYKNQDVSRGVMFTTIKVNSQLKELHPRITVLEINEVITLLNSYLGYDWDRRIENLVKYYS